MKWNSIICICMTASLYGAQIKKGDGLAQAIAQRDYEQVEFLVAEGAPYREIVKQLVSECKKEEGDILTCPLPNEKLEDITRTLQAITRGAQTYQLWQAIKDNNVTEVRKLFGQGKVGDLKRAHHGITPLLWAARHGYIDIAQRCLQQGAQVDAPDQEGTTPLLRAVQYGHYKMVQLLHAQGADVNKQDNDGLTALMWAVHHGNAGLAKWLIGAGAHMHLKNVYGVTALGLAVEFERHDIAQLLLRHGAQLATYDVTGGSPLIIATAKGDLKMVKLLLAYTDPQKIKGILNTPNQEGMTALSVAVDYKAPEIVTFLIAHGADEATLSPEQQIKMKKAIERGQRHLDRKHKICSLTSVEEEKIEEEEKESGFVSA